MSGFSVISMTEPVPEPVAGPDPEPILKRKKVKPDDFGGKDFWETLFRVGLIKKECPVCHVPTEVSMYKTRNWIPQTKCPEHRGLSCLKTGFFAEMNFKEPAKLCNTPWRTRAGCRARTHG